MGLIFAVYAAAVIIWSPIFSSQVLSRFSGAKIIPLGMFLMGSVFVAFSYLEFLTVESTSLVVAYAAVLRIIHGLASATM
jgi:hypothetical protein